MKNLKSILVIVTAFFMITLMGCSKSEAKKEKEEVTIKEEIVEVNNRDEFVDNKDYRILELVKKEKDLYVHVQADVESSKEAFEKGRFIADSIELVNKEKLKNDGIENIKVFFNGLKKDMLFDGINIIKEVSQNWGGLNE